MRAVLKKMILALACLVMLYQLFVALQIAFFASAALLVGAAMSALMTTVVFFAQSLSERTLWDLSIWKDMILPCKIVILGLAAFVMSLGLVSAPYFVISRLIRKNYAGLAIISVIFAVMQLAVLKILASPAEEFDATSDTVSVNLYPYAVSCIFLFLLLAGAAAVGHLVQRNFSVLSKPPPAT